MKKAFICLSLILTVVLGVFSPLGAAADDYSKKHTENIISGNQDYLVFASLGNKDTAFFDVQVMAIVGIGNNLTDTQKKELEDKFEKSISVSGINSYMYYGDNDDKPRTGDNVLISMNHTGGDSYVVKNGVYRVDSVSMEQFKFEVPETVDGTAEAMELSALYTYVYTNGNITDIQIRGDGVYYKSTEDKSYTKQPQNIGISLLDEFGDPSYLGEDKYPELQEEKENIPQKSKWYLVSIILIFGMVIGVFVLKLIHKLDKGYDI